MGIARAQGGARVIACVYIQRFCHPRSTWGCAEKAGHPHAHECEP